jgi:hypothetical protein
MRLPQLKKGEKLHYSHRQGEVTFPHVRFSCAIWYNTIRYVTEKFRTTNKLEGPFTYIRLRYDTLCYVAPMVEA